jgi:hypothetical protein
MIMDRRELLGVLGTTVAGLASATGAHAQAEKKSRSEHADMSHKTAKTCSDCANECNEGFHHCHQQLAAGKKEYAKAAHLCVDTADCCALAAAFCARMSPVMGHMCQACAECCEDCIAECEKLKDSQMKDVIEACRRTAKDCRAMAKMMGSKTSGTRPEK